MLCDECGQRKAVVSVMIAASNGENNTRHLCMECAANLRAHIEDSPVATLLSTLGEFFAQKLATPKDAKPQLPEIVCPECGTRYKDVLEKDEVGCQMCYDAFSAQLKSEICKRQNISELKPSTPVQSPATVDPLWEEITRLQTQMAQAVSVEDYEAAAVCRDQIRQLTTQREGSHES